MKKAIKILLMSVLLISGVTFSYAKVTQQETFTACNQKEGGPGLCVRNAEEGGFKCESRSYLGDCSGTRQIMVPAPTNN